MNNDSSAAKDSERRPSFLCYGCPCHASPTRNAAGWFPRAGGSGVRRSGGGRRYGTRAGIEARVAPSRCGKLNSGTCQSNSGKGLPLAMTRCVPSTDSNNATSSRGHSITTRVSSARSNASNWTAGLPHSYKKSRTARGRCPGGPWTGSLGSISLTEQPQHGLSLNIGLRQHRRAGLDQDVLSCEVRAFGRHIHIADDAVGGVNVRLLHCQRLF